MWCTKDLVVSKLVNEGCWLTMHSISSNDFWHLFLYVEARNEEKWWVSANLFLHDGFLTDTHSHPCLASIRSPSVHSKLCMRLCF